MTIDHVAEVKHVAETAILTDDEAAHQDRHKCGAVAYGALIRVYLARINVLVLGAGAHIAIMIVTATIGVIQFSMIGL